jgi:hypothetical protein
MRLPLTMSGPVPAVDLSNRREVAALTGVLLSCTNTAENAHLLQPGTIGHTSLTDSVPIAARDQDTGDSAACGKVTPCTEESVVTRAFMTTNGYAVTVDDADYADVTRHEWTARRPSSSHTFYVERREYDPLTKKRRLILLHREIMNAPPTVWVDHKDRNGLHNVRSNLRYCTNRQNQANQRLRDDSATGYRGVSQVKGKDLFRASIRLDGKKTYLGTYATARDAALAYDAAARSHHGEFAACNCEPPEHAPIPVTGRLDGTQIARTPRAWHVGRRGDGIGQRGDRWQARVQFQGVRKCLGSYATKEGAEMAIARQLEVWGVATPTTPERVGGHGTAIRGPRGGTDSDRSGKLDRLHVGARRGDTGTLTPVGGARTAQARKPRSRREGRLQGHVAGIE